MLALNPDVSLSPISSASAQQADNEPVNLLATVTDGNQQTAISPDGNSPDRQPAVETVAPTISSIDEAVNSVSEDAVEQQSPSDASAANIITAVQPESGNETAAVTLSTAPAATLSLTEAPRFGVANIGIEMTAFTPGLTSTIWRDTPVERVSYLLAKGASDTTSRALADLSHSVVAHRAVPPVGAAEVEQEFVSARLAWLAASGRSEDLTGIVAQLPDDEVWLNWKQWLVETQLMSRRDAEACDAVMLQVSRTLDPFWHKSKVICNAAQGDAATARFAADILFATGVQDETFSALVSTLLDGVDPGPLDPAMLDPLHVILMDAAHYPIGVDALAALPPASVQTATGLRYLDPEARLVSTWKALSHGLIDHDMAAKLWRSADNGDVSGNLALSRHQSLPTPLTRALAWKALSAEMTPARLPLIVRALDADIAAGAGPKMVPLYADLAREALGFDGAQQLLEAGQEGLIEKLGLLLAADGEAPLDLALASDVGIAASQLMSGMDRGNGSLSPLDDLGLWHLLPMIEAVNGEAEVEADQVAADWITLATPVSIAPSSYLSVSPVMLRGLEQASRAGRVGETALMAHRIVAGQDLANLHPADLARVVTSLRNIGQPDVAADFATEVARAHILKIAAKITLGAPVTPAVVDMADDGLASDAVDAETVAPEGDAPEGDAPESDGSEGESSENGTSVDDTMPDSGSSAASEQVTDENTQQQDSIANAG